MLIVMKLQASEDDIRRVCQKIEALGYRAHPMPGAQRTAIGITGNKGPLEPLEFEGLPGADESETLADQVAAIAPVLDRTTARSMPTDVRG